MTEHVRIERQGAVLVMSLDRPAKLNALTDAMYAALADAMAAGEGDPAVRVLLIRGEGAHFTAGNDLGDFARVARGEVAGPRSVGRFLGALAGAAKPLVAAVRGRAVGVGTTMLLHCDAVVLADDAELTAPFVNLALVPEAGSSLLLPARIGYARAYAMVALGEPLRAADALGCGIASAVVPAADLDAAAMRLAERLALQPPDALAATKRLMRDAGIAAAMERESAEFERRLRSPEAREAFAAFAERRRPDFTRAG